MALAAWSPPFAIAPSKAALVSSETSPDGLGRPTPASPGVAAGSGTVPASTTPAMPVLSFDMMVLLTIEALSVSDIEMPPPAQPATLFTTMLFVRVTRCQRTDCEDCGYLATSAPLTCCKRIPAPWPPSAKLPRIRFASMVTSPVPSDSAPATGGSPRTMMPPPWVDAVCWKL